MKISLENEIKLKSILKSSEIETEIKKLTKEIEYKEKMMLSCISKDYMNIIEKCNSLEHVKEQIPVYMDKSHGHIMEIKNLVAELHNVNEDIKVNEKLKERIKDVLAEIGRLESFFRDVCIEPEKNHLYYYTLCEKLQNIKMLSSMFRRYSFYDNINEVYVICRNSAISSSEKEIDKWLSSIKTSSLYIGKEILNTVSSQEAENKGLIFNEINSHRKRYISTNFLGIYYLFANLGMKDDLVKKINFDRRATIDECFNKKNFEIIHVVSSEMLFSKYLSHVDCDFKTFYNVMLDRLSKFFFDDEYLIEEENNIFTQVKSGLIPFRKLLLEIGVESDIIDQVIAKISIDFFERHEFGNIELGECSVKEFKKHMIGFISDSYNFIDQISTNEVMDIFTKKVDSAIERYLEENDDIILIKNDISEIFNLCKSKNIMYINHDLRSEKLFSEMIKSKKEILLKNLKKEIDELFDNPDENFSVTVQNKFTANYIVKNEVYHILKDKYADLVEKSKKFDIKERRVVNGRVSCFYGFLKNSEPKYVNDFRKVQDKSDELLDNV